MVIREMPERLGALEARLGASAELAMFAGRGSRGAFVRARWRCGCRAEGEEFSELVLEPCDAHAFARALAG